MPLALIVVTTVLVHAAFNGSRLTISLDALALGALAAGGWFANRRCLAQP